MARKPTTSTKRTSPAKPSAQANAAASTSTSIDDLMTAALARGDGSMETGRYLVTFKEGAAEAGTKALRGMNLRMAHARDFTSQAVEMSALGDADAVMFPEINVALVSGAAVAEGALRSARSATTNGDPDSAFQVVEPEYFVFSDGEPSDYLRGFLRAAETIAHDLGGPGFASQEPDADAQVLGATWGLNACRVPPSTRTGAGIRVAVLDTGMDLGHPDFAGRVVVSNSFVGQPVQDLHGHGTHCIGTATGRLAPAGTTPRYGVAYGAAIYVGKVLANSGTSVGGSVLAGMNWAIANNCQVISMSLGSQSPVQAAYTNAGAVALQRGLLIVAAAGNAASSTGSPANSPTIFSVASLDNNLAPSSFSNFGKVQIAAPGRDVFSTLPRPRNYGTLSGTSMATPHVAGVAALWAQSSAALRGQALWNKLLTTARPLPYAAARVGRGLVQAP